jgi:hypothetical protein
LIKVATNLAGAYCMRPRPPANGDTFASNNALDYGDRAGLGPIAASTVLRGSCTE